MPLTRNRANRSASVVLGWLNVPDDVMQATTLAAQGRLVATLSKTRTLTEIHLLEVLKKELHRRFTCDQKLGNLFLWDGLLLQLREPARTFMARGLKLFPADGPAPDPAAAEAAVHELADKLFGPFDARLAGAECQCTATECVISARSRVAAK